MTKRAVGAIVIREEGLLLVMKKDNWILPGGKPLTGETEIDALTREVAEELNGTKLKNLKPYRVFSGISPNLADPMKLKTYFAEIDGKLGNPSAEVSKVGFYSKTNSNFHLGNLTRDMIISLIEEGYLH